MAKKKDKLGKGTAGGSAALRPVAEVIAAVRGEGSFFASGTSKAAPSELVLPDGTAVTFPLSAGGVKAIKSQAEPAPYGKGSETLIDEKVRKCWQIDASRLRWESSWEAEIESIVSAAARSLGVESEVVAEPHKLLLYEKGGHFLPHRDTEKAEAMFGSLVVILPSDYRGGELRVSLGGRTRTAGEIRYGARTGVEYVAFYADCEHEVRKVKSGNRLSLTFNLSLREGCPAAFDLPAAGGAAKLLPYLERLRSTPDMTVVVLEHRYTEANLSVRKLKGHDRVRARALFAAAAESGFVARLALLTLHQSGELDVSYDRYSRWGGDPSDGRMGEVYDEELTLSGWRCPDDSTAPLREVWVSASRVIADRPLADGDPDEEEAEGFTGNAGCTMDYWYRRAAVVLWPEEANAAILAEYDFPGACVQLVGMAEEVEPDDPEFLALGRALSAHAQPWFDDPESHLYGSSAQACLPLLEAACLAGSEELLLELAEGPLADLLVFCGEDRWRALFDTFGHAAWIESLTAPVGEPRGRERADSLFSALGAMLASGEVPVEVAAPLARRTPELLRVASESAPGPGGVWDLGGVKDLEHRGYWDWDDADDGGDCERPSLTQPDRLHIAIAASYLLGGKRVAGELKREALAGGSIDHLRLRLAPALLAKRFRWHFGRPGSLFPSLLSEATRLLEETVARPLEPYPDWKRPFAYEPGALGPKQREILAELEEFMADPTAELHRFAAVEELRRFLELAIRTARLDLDHHTLRHGRPYTLVCVKNDRSFHRMVARRSDDEKLLERLRALGSSFLHD